LTCQTCGQQVRQGFEIEGAVYCLEHYRLALPHCCNCGGEIRGDYRVVGVHSAPVCLDCSERHPACFLCAAPADVGTGGGTLADGRPICGSDRKSAVFDAAAARKIFDQAASEVQQALGAVMALQVPVKDVKLVNVEDLLALCKDQYQPSTLLSGRVLGLTTLVLKSKGKRRWTEPATVHLLGGVPAERMLTVSAHEYAHVWHAENHPNYSATSAEFREGFAEWVAYKVAQHAQRRTQMSVLNFPSDGLYHQGLTGFLELESRLGARETLRHAISARHLVLRQD
jgi:hypothetical protein